MIWSEKNTEISKALVGFMADAPNIPKSSTAKVAMKAGGTYTFDFADLARVRATIRPHLKAHGLSYSSGSSPGGEGGSLAVTTRVVHASGEWVEQTINTYPDNGTPQAIGSAQTYGVRYNVMALLGLAADGEDDDGNAGSGNRANIQPKGQQPAQAPQPGPDTFGPGFTSGLRARLQRLGMSVGDLRRVMVDNGVDSSTVPGEDPLKWHYSEELESRIKRYVDSKVAMKGDGNVNG